MSAGHLHFQMNGEEGESSAFLSPFIVPLRQWCHLRVVLRGRAVSLLSLSWVSVVMADDLR